MAFTQKDWDNGQINIRAVVTVSKHANDWRFTMFFTKAVNLRSYWSCKLISVNEYKTVSLGSLLMLGFNIIKIINNL